MPEQTYDAARAALHRASDDAAGCRHTNVRRKSCATCNERLEKAALDFADATQRAALGREALARFPARS